MRLQRILKAAAHEDTFRYYVDDNHTCLDRLLEVFVAGS
jgi:hypothetical protein